LNDWKVQSINTNSVPDSGDEYEAELIWLSDEQWAKIEPLLPTGVRSKAGVNDRRVLSGILHVIKSGCRWCDCPPEYSPHTTIYNRFVRWAERGVWERLFQELARRGRWVVTQMIESTYIKAHRLASVEKGGEKSGDWSVATRPQLENPCNCRC
jgi:transposase